MASLFDAAAIAEIARFIGVLGAAIYVASYFLLQLGVVKGQSFLYPSLMIGAAGCVLFSLTTQFNLAALFIQVSYLSISVFGIIRMYMLTRAIRFTPEEEKFIDNYLEELRPHQARRLLDAANVIEFPVGHRLIGEGEVVENLTYILDGHVSIMLSGHEISECGAGEMLGELTFDTGMPATATVVCSEPTTCLIFEGHKLVPLLKRNHEINSALLASHFSSSRRKLINSNSRHLAFRQTPTEQELVGV